MIRGGDDIAFQTTAKMYTEENAKFLGWPLANPEAKTSVINGELGKIDGCQFR